MKKTKKTNNNNKTAKSKKRPNKGLVEWTAGLERERAALGLDHSKSRSEDSIFFFASSQPTDGRRTQSDAVAALLSPRWPHPTSEEVDEAMGQRHQAQVEALRGADPHMLEPRSPHSAGSPLTHGAWV